MFLEEIVEMGYFVNAQGIGDFAYVPGAKIAYFFTGNNLLLCNSILNVFHEVM